MLLIFFLYIFYSSISSNCVQFSLRPPGLSLILNSLILTRSNNDNFTNSKKKYLQNLKKKKHSLKFQIMMGRLATLVYKWNWFGLLSGTCLCRDFHRVYLKTRKFVFSHLLRACIIITHIHRFNCFSVCYGTINTKKQKQNTNLVWEFID